MTTHEQIKSQLSQIEQRENAAAIHGGGFGYIVATADSQADVPNLRKALEMAVEALNVLTSPHCHISATDPVLDYQTEISMRAVHAKDTLDSILTHLNK